MLNLKAFLLLLLVLKVSVNAFNQTQDVTKLFANQLGVSQLNFSVITGYLPLDWYFGESIETGIFYELVTKFGEKIDNVSESTPLIVWFAGGPGVSSQQGSFDEFGPVVALSNNTLAFRNNSWSDTAMLLFIDQPLLVGGSWSSTGFQVNTTEVAGQFMMNFFYNFFFVKYPQFKKNPLYIFGESYGGHYVPQFAYDLFATDRFDIKDLNLQGVAIGDGLTQALIQLSTYGSYVFQSSIVSGAQFRTLQERQINFQKLELSKQYNSAMNYSKFQVQEQITAWTQTSIGNFMQYNVPWPYPNWYNQWITWIIANRDQYGIAAGVPNDQIGGNYAMYDWFEETGDLGKSFKDKIEFLLLHTQVLLYNGQLDTLINTPGVYEMVSSFRWKNLWAWNVAPKKLLRLQNGKIVGNYKIFNNLNVAVIYDAGHLVPVDQPVAAHQLMYNFVNGLFV